MKVPFGRSNELVIDESKVEGLSSFRADMEGLEPDSLIDQLKQAIDSPINYPPLADSIVPGDRVTLILLEPIPFLEEVLICLFQFLFDCKIRRGSIVLLTSQRTFQACKKILSQFPQEETKGEVLLVVHDPDSEEQLSYLAATESERRIYLNQHIVDADFVIPLGSRSADPVFDKLSTSQLIYAQFSNAQTAKRFEICYYRKPNAAVIESLQKDAQEVSFFMGLQCNIQIVVDREQKKLTPICGERDRVDQSTNQIITQDWTISYPEKAELVLVTISEIGSETSWDEVTQGIDLATKMVDENGVIVVCFEVGQVASEAFLEGEGIKCVIGADTEQEMQLWLEKKQPPDGIAAIRIVNALS